MHLLVCMGQVMVAGAGVESSLDELAGAVLSPAKAVKVKPHVSIRT